jgi:Flavin containing amine oxidoreductase
MTLYEVRNRWAYWNAVEAVRCAVSEDWESFTPDNREFIPKPPSLRQDYHGDHELPDFEEICGSVANRFGEPAAAKVCIIGAGASGLFTGMIIDYLKKVLDEEFGINFNVTYDILEASNRVGGRLYTHHFSNSIHDYYDVGAMRFPDSPIMER